MAGGSTADGTAVRLWDCNGSAAQRWTLGADGPARALGKCLDVTSGSTADGAKVQLWSCNGSGAQQWRYEPGSADLVNVPADKCLDASDHASANGTRAQIWSCTGAANQKWRLQGSTCGAGRSGEPGRPAAGYCVGSTPARSRP
ncbi:ricin-type beta-trefoil lectin domain protein [Streptomyces sp. NPDC054802]